MDDELTEQDFPPLASGRTPSQVLASTRQRGVQLRRRARVLRAAPVLAGLALVPIVALALRSPSTATRVSTPPAAGESTTTTEQGPAGTNQAGNSTTTSTPRTTTTSARAATTTTAGARAAESTTTAPPPSPCARSQSPMSTTTDKTTYLPGQTVAVAVRTTNTSAKPCYQPGYSGARVTDSSGAVVFEVAVAASYGPGGAAAVAPGESRTVTWQWDQRGCSGSTCKQVGPGTYNIELFFGDYPSVWTSPKAQITVGR